MKLFLVFKLQHIHFRPNLVWPLSIPVSLCFQVSAFSGPEPALDPAVQEAPCRTFCPAGEAQLLDGHHRGGNPGNHHWSQISGTNPSTLYTKATVNLNV